MAVTNPAKELAKLERRLRPQGWILDQVGRRHPTWVSPDGTVRIQTSRTSHGGRGWANMLADLKRAGADLDTDVAPTRSRRPRTPRQEAPALAVRPHEPERSTALVEASPATHVARAQERIRHAVAKLVPHEPEHRLEDVPAKMATCRVLRHAWEPRGRGKSSFGVALVLECLRCGTVRRDLIQGWSGKVLARGYTYEDAYHVTGERPTMDEWRAHWVTSLEEELPEEPEVVMEPRKLKAVS